MDLSRAFISYPQSRAERIKCTHTSFLLLAARLTESRATLLKWCLPQRDGSSSIPLPRQSRTDEPTGQHNIDNYSLRFPFKSFQVVSSWQLKPRNTGTAVFSLQLAPLSGLPTSSNANGVLSSSPFCKLLFFFTSSVADILLHSSYSQPKFHPFMVLELSVSLVLLLWACGDTGHHDRSPLHGHRTPFTALENQRERKQNTPSQYSFQEHSSNVIISFQQASSSKGPPATTVTPDWDQGVNR